MSADGYSTYSIFASQSLIASQKIDSDRFADAQRLPARDSPSRLKLKSFNGKLSDSTLG